MATLQKIRNRAGVLIAVVIGLALFAFILGDMMRSGKSLSSSSDMEVVNVAGKSIAYQEYIAKVDEIAEIQKQNSGKTALDENTMDMIREQTWDLLLRQLVMEDEYSELGLAVTPEEMADMTFGRNIHPQVKQLFTDPKTGVFDTARVVSFLKNMDQDQTGKQKAYWLFVEQALQRDRQTQKYNNLIKKGLYIPTEMAKNEATEKNHKVGFKFAMLNYNTISDSAVKVNDADINAYYNNNKNKYEQEASRDIEYVSFEVLPSDDDKLFAKTQLEKTKEEFTKTEDLVRFVELNSDVPYDDAFVTKSKLTPVLDSMLFNAKVGDMYGPYSENNAWKLSRLIDTKMISDSVKASHILISIDEKTDSTKAKAIVDSLKRLVEKKADFAELAIKFSKDQGSGAKGGDLGWFKQGMMVKPFNDACFYGKKGELKVVVSQFGVHLIKIIDKSKESKNVKIATIEKQMKPSSKTYQLIYTKASEFALSNNTTEKFDKAITVKNLNKKIANNIKENDKKIAGIENPRELVRWCYEAEKGHISKAFEFGSLFVVAKVTEVREKGIAPLAQKKEEIETIVKRDKKAELLQKKFSGVMATAKTIEEIATKAATTVGTAENISFSSFSIQGAGIEPVVIASASVMKKAQISKPLKGNNGVFVISIDAINETSESDFSTEQRNLTNAIQGQVDYKVYEALKKLADVKDLRSKFF